ncbi:hypothetical protein OBBRIDRAFT_840180 [Obba rivulosa]|uniref:Uncharacterized protein n=1 Tax=Obba rivulosa TaxID=1052685 RepID=A0A8E2AI27_9APHY|nr:hypothetical protein OBBRIDRAFT_840180 [Obba rivulosa]
MESGSRTCKKLQQDLLKICRENAGIVDQDGASSDSRTTSQMGLLTAAHFAKWE